MIKIDSEEINDKWCQELRIPIINVSKGGAGSGIKGHTTWKRGSGAQRKRWNIDAEEIEWKPSNLVNTDNKDLRPRIRLMSPQEYIDRMGPENRDRPVTAKDSLKQKKRGYKGVMTYPFMPYKIEALKEAIEMGNSIERVSLEYNEEGEVENQEGFHRALIARAMGIKKIPVEVVRRGKDKELPKKYKRMHWKDENQMIALLKEANILPILDFSKGGEGSGIKGHRTQKEDKAHRIIKNFEEKIRNELIEHSLFVDGDGKIILQKSGGEHNISFSEGEMLDIKLADNVIFTHNHPKEFVSPFSLNDLRFVASKGIKEGRIVSGNKLYVVKLKGKISPDLIQEKYQKAYEAEYFKCSMKVTSGELTNKEGNDMLFHKIWSGVAKEIPQLTYKKESNQNFSKGGLGSGIRGHTTQREKKAYKIIKNFENKIRGESIENCLIADGEGKVLISKQGTEDTIYLTENEGYTCREKAKKGKVVLTHNHPSSSSFSVEDFLLANTLHLSEIRIVSKKHDYVMKISKSLDEYEVMASYKGQYTHFYNKFNPWVVFRKLDKDKAWMTHTHLIWKHVAEEIDGLEYKRTR